MGFNYLQTDDRDDYFATLGNKKSSGKKSLQHVSVIDPSGERVLENVWTYVARKYARDKFCTKGESAKRTWRDILTKNGYTIINHYAKN